MLEYYKEILDFANIEYHIILFKFQVSSATLVTY